MDSTGKSSSGLEAAIVAVDGANTSKNTGSTRSMALLDINQPADAGDEDGLHVVDVEAEGGGGGGSSSHQRSYGYGRLSREQINHLETVFQQNKFPDTKTKEELVNRTGMTLDKVHIWFRSRRTRFNQIKRDEDQKQQVNKFIDEIKSLAKENTLLTAHNTSLTEKIISLTEKVCSLADKSISVYEQNSSLKEEKHRLESELAEIKAAPMPPVMLPIHGHGLPHQVFVKLCPVCSPIFRDTAAAGGALPGSQNGSATAKLCPDCLKTFENVEAMVASFAQRQLSGAAARGSA